MAIVAEYIWIDGSEPTRQLRSKTKVLPADFTVESEGGLLSPKSFPEWGFDGSSTNQADGDASDCKLLPARVVPDPIRGVDAYLVLCEVLNPADNTPHATNTRAKLSRLMESAASEEPWIGIEQEYTMFKGSSPLGFPTERRFPGPQGPYYCGVGADEVFGREVAEDHLDACIEAGLAICGINAEVMPGQWEFQIGGPDKDPLLVADDLWIARWLLYRIGEDYGISATLDAKPVPGDWNGAGAHTNFSTKSMREDGGYEKIIEACEKISKRVPEHLAAYGDGFEARLTGRHETCRYDEFKYGTGDRTASIRIPAHVKEQGKGYLEDRRPNANIDPYRVGAVLLETILGLE
jgi:glutamine synthetase